jgi:flagellar basal-body rod protein FlgB
MLDGLPSRIERYMDLLAARQKLVARNIANADTPGYKSQDIDFQQELQRLSEPAGDPAVTETAGQITKSDGNNVNLDREARMLSENDIRFNIATQLMRGQIKEIHEAINEGRSQ